MNKNVETRPLALRLEFISLGDELLLGLRPNSHLTYIGRQLAKFGHTIQRNVVIRDQPEDIARIFSESWDHSDVIITTGGLGPTTDDLTRETISEIFGLDLVHNDDVEKAIRERFAGIGRDVTENNLRQAKILDGAEVLPNEYGTAPGMWLRKDGKHLVMLPGPPNELYPMFEEQVLPRLQAEGLIGSGQAYLQVRTCGVGESHLETKLQPVFDRAGELLQVAYCAHDGLVDLRLSSLDERSFSWQQVEEVGDECREILGTDYVCFGDHSVAQLIMQQLRALGRTVAVGESCTGGLLSNAFTDIPGASQIFAGGVVCYNTAAKVEMLGVPDSLIRQHGVVSAECAAAMATGVSEKFSTDYGIGITGIAGPGGGTCSCPVGTVFIGYHAPGGVWSHLFRFPSDRLSVKSRSVATALDLMRRKLKESEMEDVLSSMIT